MVVFICDGCSAALKKNQVDSHAARCRVCQSVCCVDCNVSFFGDDYRAHTTCVTEAERYEGKKPKVKASPQDAWMVLIADSVGQAPGHLKPHLSAMVSLANVPRKAKAFRNFTANSLNLRGKQGDGIVTALWDFLQQVRSEHQQENTATKSKSTGRDKTGQQQSSSSSVTDNNVESSNEVVVAESSQLTKVSTDEQQTKQKSVAMPAPVDKETVKKAMKRILKKHKSLTVKVLRKEVRVKLGNLSKSQVKELVQAELGDKASFTVEGKTIQLRATG